MSRVIKEEVVSVTQATRPDTINTILGAGESSRIAALRNQKPELIGQLQDYYLAIFEPNPYQAGEFSALDRFLIAVRVASHTGSAAVADWYANLATEAGADAAVLERIRDVATPWTDETPLGAAVRRSDLVTVRPADTEPSDIQALKDAGFSPAGILSLSQVIAFVSYQLRLIAGLRALGEAS
jgi:uncharacterized protein YciW